MEQHFIVTSEQTAKAMGSGDLEVLSTPYLVAMVENTCLKSILEKLSDEETTVGVNITIDHLKGTKVGESYRIVSKLIKEGKKSYHFEFVAFSQNEIIAKGTHLRVRVNKKDFMASI